MTAPLCFLDTETTGVHPDREIWEIGMIRREPDGAEYEWSCFLPVDLSKADPFGLQIGGFWERHPFGREAAGHFTTQIPDGVATLTEPPEPGQVEYYCLPQFAVLQVMKFTHGAHVVGSVPSFDTVSLEKLIRAKGGIPGWHYHLVDVENLAVGYLAAQADGGVLLPPWSSEDLSRACGVEPPGPDERHTALGDARWARRLWDAIMCTAKSGETS